MSTSITSLPTEILIQIFREYMHGIRITYKTELPSVLAVCREWRSIALDDSVCWARINIYMFSDAYDHYVEVFPVIRQLKRWIALTRNNPVDISIEYLPSGQSVLQYADEIGDALTTDRTHFPNLKTYWEAGDYEVLTPLLPFFSSEHFQHLTHLRLFSSRRPRAVITLPQLRVLCYQTFYNHYHMLSSPTLTNLTLAATYTYYPMAILFPDVVKAMQFFPNANKLVLHNFMIRAIAEVDLSIPRERFRGIQVLAIGTLLVPGRIQSQSGGLLLHFPNATTLLIGDPLVIVDPAILHRNCEQIKELVFLEYARWSGTVKHIDHREASRAFNNSTWGHRFFKSAQELRCLRIGREIQEDDPYFRFDWPHLHNKSEAHWEPSTLSAIVRALGPQGDEDTLSSTVFCPKLEHIHLTCIHFDEYFITHLLKCLRARHQNAGTTIRDTLITTIQCTSDMGATLAFPDVVNLSYPEFEDLIINHDKGSKSMLVWFFGLS